MKFENPWTCIVKLKDEIRVLKLKNEEQARTILRLEIAKSTLDVVANEVASLQNVVKFGVERSRETPGPTRDEIAHQHTIADRNWSERQDPK